MKRIKKMSELQKIKINQNAYIGFHLYMVENIKQLEKVLSTKGALNTAEIKDLVNKYVGEL